MTWKPYRNTGLDLMRSCNRRRWRRPGPMRPWVDWHPRADDEALANVLGLVAWILLLALLVLLCV